MNYYKVVTSNLESLGLRNNPNIMTFKIGDWTFESNPTPGKADEGGIWVCKTKSRASELMHYMKSRWGKDTRLFLVVIGNVLYSNSYRIKTDRVKLVAEVPNA